ncbi:MAG: hypothetical protein V3V62_07240 [bacterium]
MGKIPVALAAAAMLVLLSGCVTTTWRKVGTPAQAAKDLKTCADKAGLHFDPNGLTGGPTATISQNTYQDFLGAPFEKCMKAKGYRKAK